MKKARASLWLMLLTFCAALFPLGAAANAPAPPNYLYMEITGADEAATRADVLAQLSPEDEGYTALNRRVLSGARLPEDAPIVAYDEEGFVSLTLHLQGVSGNDRLTEEFEGKASGLILLPSSNQPLDKIAARVKVALLDDEGRVLQVSPVVEAAPPDADSFLRTLHYDAQADTLTATYTNYYHGSAARRGMPPLWAVLARLLLSVGGETALALAFRLRAVWKVAAVNLTTQLLLILFLSLSGLPYMTAVLVGEIAVYAAEFIAYLFLYRGVSRWRVLGYTALANTATLAMGLLFNQLGWLLG